MKSSYVSMFIIGFLLIGDTFFRDVFQSIWLGVTILFFIFLVAYQWFDRKRVISNKKHDSKD